MKNKKLFALILAVVLLVTQFATVGTVYAVSALSGRSDFEYGINIHQSHGYAEYTKPYDAVLESEALGATLIRTGTESDDYDAAFAELANRHGMNVMFHMSLGSALKNGNTIKTPEQVGYDAFQAIYDKFYSKANALKNYDCYIQIGNELDNSYKISGRTGTESSHYNSVQSLAIAIYLANKAVHDANTDNGSTIKTVLNFAFYHYGFFDALKAVKINPGTYTVQSSSSGAVYADWDIIGWDYYSNMYDDATYQSILPTVKSKYSSKNIIVCESNLTPQSKNGNGTINYAQNVSWLDDFVRYCYNDSKVIGFCAYELYDQAHYEDDLTFHQEAHFGLIDNSGNKKDTYNLFRDLYGGTGVVAARTVSAAPAAPANIEQEISVAGVSTFFGADYLSTPNRLSVDFRSSPLDLSAVNQFEFDLYIEDYDEFLLCNPGRSGGKRINFAFSNTDTKTEKRVRFDIANQITGDGWNHIVLRIGENWQKDSGFSFAEVKWLMIYFQDGGDAYNPIAGMKAAIANVYATTDAIDILPDAPDYALTVASREGKTKSWGDYYHYTNDRVYIDLSASPVDMSAAELLEFDIFIRDRDAFLDAIDGRELRFYVASGASRNDNRRVYAFPEAQVTQDGWNHIILGRDSHVSTNSCSFSAIKWIGFFFNKGASVANPIANTEVRFANVCASLKEINRTPAAPENAAVEVSAAGKTHQWGDYFSYVTDRMYIDVDSIDLSSVKFIEFDIYIEDQAAFHTAFDSHALRFYLSSADNRNNNRRKYNFVDQITQDGWNHICLNRECRYSSDSTALGSIKHVGLTCDSNTGDANTLKNVSVRIANIYGTSAPAHPDYAVVDLCTRLRNYETGSDNNKAGIQNYQDFDGKKENVLSSDISTCDQIEFDFYCASYPAFLSNISGHTFYFVLTTNGDSSHRARYRFTDQVTKNGWNHIVLNIADRDSIGETPNFANVSQFYFSFWGTSGSMVSKENPVFATNVCATLSAIKSNPAAPANAAVEVSADGKMKTWGEQFGYVTDRLYIDVDSIDLSSVKFIEFDIYIEDQAAFHTAFDSHALRFYLSSADNRNNNRRKYNFVDQITQDGWNHICLNRECRYSSDSTALGSIKHVGLTCDSNTGDANTLKNVSVRIANIYGTSAPAHPDYAVVDLCTRLRNYETGSDNNKAGIQNYQDFDGKKENVLSSDISTCDQIEFDFYCASYPAFLSNISGHTFYFVLTTNGDSSHRARYRFTDQVTKNGWNHIVLNIADRDSIGETPNFANVSQFYFSFWGTSGSMVSKENPVFATNVCGSYSASLSVPTDVMVDKTSFVGAVQQAVKFDSEGYYDVSFASEMDISDARMIEMDVFIPSGSMASFGFELLDSSDNIVSYSFTGLTTGWNHLVKRINDYDEATANLTDITGYSIIGDANASIIVSNFYAADYTDGDANRDGVVSVSDYVHIKQYVCGTVTTGNLLAMDLQGSDYTITLGEMSLIRELVSAG